MKKLAVWFFIAMNFGLFIATPAVGFLLYSEPPPVNYGRREVLNKDVPPGGVLKIAISTDITKKCDAVVYRRIIDFNGVLFDIFPERRSTLTDYIVEVPIPLGAAPGMAYYSARIEWKCNFVQKWFPQEVLQRNIPFNIVPSEGQMPVPEQQGIYQVPMTKSELAIGEVK